MSIQDRVLGSDGLFHPFPQRHIDKAVEHGTREAVDPGEPEALLPESGTKGKAQLMKEAYEREKSQAAVVRMIQEAQAKKIAEEQAYKDAKENPVEIKDPPQYADQEAFEEPLIGHGTKGKAELEKKALHGQKAQDLLELDMKASAALKENLENAVGFATEQLNKEKAVLEAIEKHKSKHRMNK
jgi:hypothetical protein